MTTSKSVPAKNSTAQFTIGNNVVAPSQCITSSQQRRYKCLGTFKGDAFPAEDLQVTVVNQYDQTVFVSACFTFDKYVVLNNVMGG